MITLHNLVRRDKCDGEAAVKLYFKLKDIAYVQSAGQGLLRLLFKIKYSELL